MYFRSAVWRGDKKYSVATGVEYPLPTPDGERKAESFESTYRHRSPSIGDRKQETRNTMEGKGLREPSLSWRGTRGRGGSKQSRMKRPNPSRSSGGSSSRNASNGDNSGSGRPRCRRLPSKRKRPMKKSFVAPASLANILLSTGTVPRFRPRF